MKRAASFGGVILAAGESSRMGRDKALLPWPPAPEGGKASGSTFLSAAIRTFLQVTDFVVVVAGKNKDLLSPVIFSEGASLVVNSIPERGQFSSLQEGLREVLNRGRDGAMITHVDRPPVKTATLTELVDAFEGSASGTWAVVPQFSGKHGHPLVIGREMIEMFLRAPETSTAREVEGAHLQHIHYLEVEDAAVAVNINLAEEYERLKARP